MSVKSEMTSPYFLNAMATAAKAHDLNPAAVSPTYNSWEQAVRKKRVNEKNRIYGSQDAPENKLTSTPPSTNVQAPFKFDLENAIATQIADHATVAPQEIDFLNATRVVSLTLPAHVRNARFSTASMTTNREADQAPPSLV